MFAWMCVFERYICVMYIKKYICVVYVKLLYSYKGKWKGKCKKIRGKNLFIWSIDLI